jgi:hypothetical protein
MRLLCPFCQKPITVPDSEAGKTVNCPECREQFAAPQLFTPAPTAYEQPQRPAWAPTTPPVPETYVSREPAAEPTEIRTPPGLPSRGLNLSDFRKVVSVPLKPEVVRWITPAAVTLVFFLTFVPWNGLYPGGYPAYTQSAWQCLFGAFSHDPAAEQVMQFSTELEKHTHSNLWLLLYLFLLFPALVLAVAGPIIELGRMKLPPAIEPYWKYRPLALGGVLLFMFLLLLLQCATGFGLQRAVDEYAEEKYATQTAAAKTPEQKQTVEMMIDGEKGSKRVKTTSWLRLAIFFHLIAILAAAAEAGLALRGHKPPPRVAAMW